MATITSLYSLPEKVPELVSYGYSSTNLSAAFAIYHTIPLSADERAAVLAAILSESNADAAKFSKSDFSGRDNAAVAAHHVAVAQQQGPDAERPELHPTSIIMVDDADWRTKGVVLASLNADGEGSTEAFRVPADGAALILTNIEIGNSSWEEEADSAEDKIPQDRPATSLSQSLGGALPVSYRDGSTTLIWTGRNGQTDPCFPLFGPPGKYHFTKLQARTNGREAWDRGLDHCPCRLAPWIDEFEVAEREEDMAETLKRVAKLQVDEREKDEPHLVFHPRLFVWADEDFEKEGVLVCEFDVVDGKPTAVKSKKVPVERAVVELLKKAKGE